MPLTLATSNFIMFDRPLGPGSFEPQTTRTNRSSRAGIAGFGLTDRFDARRASPVSRTPIERLPDRAGFDALAQAGVGAGAAGSPEVKFLIDRETQKVYFIPKEVPYHYDFARKFLDFRGDVRAFNRQAYLDPNRRYIAGTLNAFDQFEQGTMKGVFGISYWSTDIVRAPLLLETHRLLKAAMPFAEDKLVYHPLGNTHEALLDDDNGADKAALKDAGISILNNSELTKNFKYLALNPGKSFGKLHIIHGSGEGEPLTRRDIVIYADNVPADPPPLAGICTPKPQTYLSHVALKARQDKTPYAYSRDVLNDPKVRALEGQVVSFEVTPEGIKIDAADPNEAEEYFQKLRPTRMQDPNPDLSVKEIRSLDAIRFKDAGAFGAKTANVAELHWLHLKGKFTVGREDDEPEVIAPDGFGIPASFHADFMKTARYDATHTFAEKLAEMLGTPLFTAERPTREQLAERKQQLEAFQEALRDAAMPAGLHARSERFKSRFKAKFPGEDIRLRSSNPKVEDIKGFSAAGLFDSYTFRWDEADRPNRSFDKRLQRVFGSVYNWRAFDEFDFYRINLNKVSMAELSMASTGDEVANGVVRWGGGIPGWETMSVNAQVRDLLVTNPENGATPDAIVVGNYGFNGEPEIQYEATTNQDLVGDRKHALTDGEIRALFRSMKVIQEHFKKLYKETKNPDFNIECEFKITKDGKLLIKQARPWI